MLAILTGDIGVGKTTVCRKLIALARDGGYTCGGIVTSKAADGGITIEDIRTGQATALASTRAVFPGPHVGQYYFSPEGIAFGLKAIENGGSAGLLVVDEVGPLELEGLGFAAALPRLCGRTEGHCLVVIRRGLVSAFLPQLGDRAKVVEATRANRQRLPRDIISLLDQSKLQSRQEYFSLWRF